MNFNPSRAEALNHLNNFIENNLSEYSKLRNLILDLLIDQIFPAYLHILHME